MSFLKSFEINPLAPTWIISFTIFMLLLFGVAVNGCFELWKLIPTIRLTGKIDWQNLVLNASPALLFIALSTWYINKIKNRLKQRETPIKPRLSPHKGIVIALSKPNKSAEDINNIIEDINTNDVESLFAERSIGQLFKGIYYHKDILKHVFTISTTESSCYNTCIEKFVKKYIPTDDIKFINHHIPYEDDNEIAFHVKKTISFIYDKHHLIPRNLKRSDVIVDISGGTKTITIGLVFGALDSDIGIQYVEQNKNELIYVHITPENILDKIKLYLKESEWNL